MKGRTAQITRANRPDMPPGTGPQTVYAARKIGLLDHMGGGNLGDDATQEAVIQNLRQRCPHAAIFGFSLNPDDTRNRHGIPSFAIRTRTWTLGADATTSERRLKHKVKSAAKAVPSLFWALKALNTVLLKAPRGFCRELFFLVRSFGIIRSFDLLIINGGGQLTESWGGAWGFPYTIYKWTVLARLARIQCIFLNVGAGPLTRRLSKYFVRKALRSANYVSFRDAHSEALAQQIGFKGTSHVFPDCAYGLHIPVFHAGPALKERAPIVGFAPMAYRDPRVDPKNDPSAYRDFIQVLGLFGSWLIAQGYSLRLFCSDIGIDPPVIEDLDAFLRTRNSVHDSYSSSANSVSSTRDLLRTMSSMDYVVTCRFHGVVFAHMLNKPVLAISHHPKVATMMDNLGLSKYCVDIQTRDVNVLADAFTSLVNDQGEIKSRMKEHLTSYKRELAMQFDGLFSPHTR